MNTTERCKLTKELQEWAMTHKTKTPMRDLFLEHYGNERLTDSTIIALWDEWVKVARMSGVSNVLRRGNQWTENSVIVREGLSIIR